MIQCGHPAGSDTRGSEIGILESILAGAIQGITEFFPVSSSGHLVILHSFFGFNKPTILFDIALHSGTLFAIIIFFRRDIYMILKKEKVTLLVIAAGSIPIVFAGIFFEEKIETFFTDVRLVSIMLVLMGCWLILSGFVNRAIEKKVIGKKNPGFIDAFLIGIAQALAVIPGISRSGATISSGMMLGLKRADAFRFSFLLSIPAVFGAVIYKLKNMDLEIVTKEMANYALGTITAFVIGLIALRLLSTIVRLGKLHYFGIYCLVLGLVTFTIL